jgi:hypothetical protein
LVGLPIWGLVELKKTEREDKRERKLDMYRKKLDILNSSLFMDTGNYMSSHLQHDLYKEMMEDDSSDD